MKRNTPQYKKLEALWDKKLKKSGFEDAEQRTDGRLKAWDSYRFSRWYGPEAFKLKQEYYQGAGRFLHDYNFKTPTERKIWDLHSQGISIRDIVKHVAGSEVKSAWKVNKIIQKLSKEMLRLWSGT